MRIRKLRLSGFKSFVEPAELRIEPGLTGIVGPNGCGKSNLLEAIRWVMGESSAKSMRGSGMDDVIFAGTATRPARDFAEVTILTDRAEPDGDGLTEAEIVRRIERGTGSAYRLNGRDVRAKDVALLFADAATGAHSPALVSQGKIAAVIAAKPQERRQMLEEAAGIAGLHVRRKDAEQKLRAAETNLTKLDEVMADMETRANALRRQARAAERYRTLSEEIRTAEARLIFARWRDAAAAAKAAEQEARAAETAVEEATLRHREATELQAATIEEVARLRAEAQSARDAETEITHRLAALRSERDSAVRRLIELAARRETLMSDRAREDRLAIDAADALEALGTEAKTLASAIENAETGRGEIQARVAEATEQVRATEVELARAMAAQAAQQAEARVAEAALASARQRLARAQAEANAVTQQFAALGDASQHEQARDTARHLRDTASQGIARAVETISAAEAERDAAAAAREEAESRGSAARARCAALRSEAKSLGATDRDGGDRALAQVRAEKGYERALAAALGDDLEAGVGPEGKRGWRGVESAPDDPAFPPDVVRLADHVEAPAELRRRLAQVGVVDQDDGTILLAVGQRLVTRDGRMRRWDGFAESESGLAAAERLIRANRLREIEAELPAAEQDVEAATDALAQAQARAQAARSGIEKARANLAELEGAQRRAIREEDAATAAIERLEAARASLAERRERATAELGEAETEVTKAEAAVAALPSGEAVRAEVASLQASGEAARTHLTEVRSAAATLDQSIARDRSRREAAMAEARNWRARAGDAAKRIEEMDKRIAEAETETATLAERPATLEASIARTSTEAEEARERAATARAAQDAAEQALRKAEGDLQAEGEALASAREARAGAIARFENQEQRRVEMGRISGERFECPAPVLPAKANFDPDSVGESGAESTRLERLTQDRERIGPVNLIAETELTELEEARATSQAEREELGHAINRLRGSIGNLNREGRARLMAAFQAVDTHFRRLFTTLFAGGEAHLALIDSDDPLEAGLEIMAQPPGKKLGSLTLLSGGEQALTAVALIFALFLTNPAPICVLDEVDAPLDDANIERFCDLLDQMARETETRYLIVTHNAVTMARMHRLYGVTMIERGVSRLVSVDLSGAEGLLAAAE